MACQAHLQAMKELLVCCAKTILGYCDVRVLAPAGGCLLHLCMLHPPLLIHLLQNMCNSAVSLH